MVREADPDAFRRKLEERRNQKSLIAPPPVPSPAQQQWDPSLLLPELNSNLSDADRELDDLVNSIDIVDAYNKFCGKMVPEVGGKREGIMISCPNPAHRDSNPSAWISLDKQTYFCAGCDEGGDAHDIAALNLGYPVPGYKQGETFHKLRQQMGEAFGYRVKKVAGGTVSWIEPQSTAVSQNSLGSPESHPGGDSSTQSAEPVLSDGSDSTAPDGADGVVSHLYADEDEPEVVTYPHIKWNQLIPEDTFLYEYMKACVNDDSPEEYHFWHGLMALGLTVGRRVTLDDTIPVHGNLLLCILGATGDGKSKSRRHLNYVLRETSPYKEDGSSTVGVKIIPVPGSGEYMVSEFNYEGKDPSNNNRSLGPQPVTGLVDFDEMSALLSRANRPGATLKTTLMSFADAATEVSIGSLTRGAFVANRPFCSITASTQPRALRAIINHVDSSSGFLNRWVFVGGPSKETEAMGGARSKIRVDLTRAVEELNSIRSWGAFERSIQMDDDAYDNYLAFFREVIAPTKQRDQTDLLKRIDLLMKKLMLILTINLKLEKVPDQVVEAIKPLFYYSIESYGIVNSNIGVTAMQDVMIDIQRHIQRHKDKTGRGASARDIARYTHRKNYSLEQIKKALDVMTALDLIELEPKMNGGHLGRPSIRYVSTAGAS